MYHAENVLFVMFFMVGEVFLIVPVYMKVFWNIQRATQSMTTFLFLVVWTIFGLPLCLLMALKDTFNLLKILQASEGFLATKEYQELNSKNEMHEDEFDLELRIKVQNQVRDTVIQLYKDLRSKAK